jgi:riboflavin kinase/FMN adenylyltransferase
MRLEDRPALPTMIPELHNGCVAVVGVFDGVHRGHRAIVGRGHEFAQALKLPLVVVTFDPNPVALLQPAAAPKILASLDYRDQLLRAAGADYVWVLNFTAEVAEMSQREFVLKYLVSGLGVRSVVVGQNFRFGHRAAGSVADLKSLGLELNFTAQGLDLVADDTGLVWSSTEIRELVASGDVMKAAQGLERPHRVEGLVVRGDQRGRDLGFPTANVSVSVSQAVPEAGVYAGWFIGDPYGTGQKRPAAISVGVNQTFGGTEARIEAFVLDAEGWLELYDTYASVDFVSRLRPMQKYDSVAQLVRQMEFDVAAARTVLMGSH